MQESQYVQLIKTEFKLSIVCITVKMTKCYLAIWLPMFVSRVSCNPRGPRRWDVTLASVDQLLRLTAFCNFVKLKKL